MRLVELIRNSRGLIIKNWIDFARTLEPNEQVTELLLRDHVGEILDAIALDMEKPQSDDQQTQKAMGVGGSNAMDTVSRVHAKLRIGLGFRIDQIIAEYRALRASVLRLCESEELSTPGTMHDVTRFNEAIDSAIAEVLLEYTEAVALFRDQSLAILGHDLRTPLTAITLFAQTLTARSGGDDGAARLGSRILRGAERMNRIVGEFMDLAQTRFGFGLNLKPGLVDFEALCRQVLGDLSELYPDVVVHLQATGNLQGEWDADRLAEMTLNLVTDAIQHGGGKQVSLVARDDGEDVEFEVHHKGCIPPEMMGKVFEPYVRSVGDMAHTPGRSIGLGLYLTQQIAVAHGGTVDVTSTNEMGTTFHVRLPRRPKPVLPSAQHPLRPWKRAN